MSRWEDHAAGRFWSKVKFTDDCWEWTGALCTGGYAWFSFDGAPLLGHRWAYEFCVGPIPSDLEIDHICRTRSCVRPEHLEPVTRRVNIMRGCGPTLTRLRAQAQTHCKRGHWLNGSNLYMSRDGKRVCRACARMHHRRYYQEKKAG